VAEFLADIAGMLELFAIAAGLVLLHRAAKEAPARLLKAAGWVLVAGGIVVGLCTSYYWYRYQARGEFDSGHMGYPGMMYGEGGSMGPGMRPGMMGPGMTGPGMMTPGSGATPPSGEGR